MRNYDVIILGAGASGLMAATQLYKRKKSVLIIDMGNAPARKVAISGGGKCNFTNLHADYSRYFGQNPQFVRSGLAQWTPTDTVNWVRSHNIEFYEKEPGRYFCQNSADDIVNTLMQDIKNTEIRYNTNVIDIHKNNNIFVIKTDHGEFHALSVIVATGGLSYSHLGVSNIGHTVAKKFGHKIIPPHPGLCAIKTKAFDAQLAGISLPVEIQIGKAKITDDLLFTHFGIGGPAAYRASLYNSNEMKINFAPKTDIFEFLTKSKRENGKKSLTNIIASVLPNKLARFLCEDTRNIADIRDTELCEIANKINHFEITDAHAIGMQSAEVTVGGIATDKISSKTMESQLCPGLFFAGEVMDIAGDLGGFNLQWAFSSGFVAGNNA